MIALQRLTEFGHAIGRGEWRPTFAQGIYHNGVAIEMSDTQAHAVLAGTTSRINEANIADAWERAALEYTRLDATINSIPAHKRFEVKAEPPTIFGCCAGRVLLISAIDHRLRKRTVEVPGGALRYQDVSIAFWTEVAFEDIPQNAAPTVR